MECEHGRNLILQAVPLCLSRLRDLLNGTSPMRKVCVWVWVGERRGEEGRVFKGKTFGRTSRTSHVYIYHRCTTYCMLHVLILYYIKAQTYPQPQGIHKHMWHTEHTHTFIHRQPLNPKLMKNAW